LKDLGDSAELLGVLVDGYHEFQDRGVTLEGVITGFQYAWQGEATADDWIYALNEGVTTTTVVTLKALPIIGGFLDFSGEDFQKALADVLY
jgi:hypothetical protein